MTELNDTARFGALEEDAVVLASLVCPYCLHSPAHVLVNNRAAGADAICACGRCDLVWSVALDGDQAMRLFMAPPRSLWLQHRFERSP
jgi:hypothetical protein